MPRKSCAVASRKISDGIGMRRETEIPESLIPSSLPRRFSMTRGVSAYWRTCGCSVFTLPNAPLNLPAFTMKSPGSVRNVMYPSSIPTSPVWLPKVTKKSARAYGSTIACRPISDSLSWRLGWLSTVVVADEAERVADDGDVGVEDVAGLAPSARPPEPPQERREKRRFLRKGRGARPCDASLDLLSKEFPPKR